MKSLLIKGSLVLALAAVFGMPNASAAPLVAVEPVSYTHLTKSNGA